MNQNKIKVMVVDDHLMVRKGLALFVGGYSDMELVGEAADSQTAVVVFAETQPDVVLMDMKLPDRDGAATIAEIRKRHPNARVIALTSFADDDTIDAALHAGARGFLLKDVSVEELANAIRTVHQGKVIFDEKASEVLYGLLAKSENVETKTIFSKREKDVLRHLVNGLTNKQIAARLKVQPSTIKQYLSSIFTKLRVQSRTEAVAETLRMGLIEKK